MLHVISVTILEKCKLKSKKSERITLNQPATENSMMYVDVTFSMTQETHLKQVGIKNLCNCSYSDSGDYVFSL